MCTRRLARVQGQRTLAQQAKELREFGFGHCVCDNGHPCAGFSRLKLDPDVSDAEEMRAGIINCTNAASGERSPRVLRPAEVQNCDRKKSRKIKVPAKVQAASV